MKNIIIVDDHDDIRFLISKLLSREGYRVREAADGIEALGLVRSEPADLVVLDLLMPGMDGFEFVRRLRSEPAIAMTPVIFYSAIYFAEDVASLAKACGVSRVLSKPATARTLLDTVGAVLGETPVASPISADEFNREHLRLVSGKLSETFRTVLARMADMIGPGPVEDPAGAREQTKNNM